MSIIIKGTEYHSNMTTMVYGRRQVKYITLAGKTQKAGDFQAPHKLSRKQFCIHYYS